jgi:signal transduction histidine kinase
MSEDPLAKSRMVILPNWPSCQCADISCSTKQYADELETLLTIQQAITSHLSLDDVLQLIAGGVQRLTGAQLSLLYVLDGSDLRVAAVSGKDYSERLIGSRIPVSKSVAGKSIQIGQALSIPDVQTIDEPVDREALELFGDIQCYMTVPLISGTRPIGVIAVADRSKAVLAADNLRVLSMLAPCAVIGLENARLYQEQQERQLEVEGRHQMAESLRVMLDILNSDRSLQEILDYIVTHVSSRLLDCQAMAIYSLEPRNGELSIQAAYGLPGNFSAEAISLPWNEAVSQCIHSSQPVPAAVVTEKSLEGMKPALSSEEWALACQVMSHYQAWLAVPLIVKGQVFGAILMFYSQPRDFSEEEIGVALTFSDQVALAIENARLRQQAEQAAVIAERNRLARELHDSVNQSLFSTSLIAEVLPRLWDRNQEEGRQRLEELRQLTRGAMAEMRTLLFELRPAAFKEARLGDLLKLLTQGVAGRARIPITLTVDGDRTLPPDVQLALYRIAQEALNNVVKYADPRQTFVSLRCQPGQVELTICDDGRGFDPNSVSPEHLGVRIMHERAAAIHAVMNLKSSPGHGTQIEVIWPVSISKEQS